MILNNYILYYKKLKLIHSHYPNLTSANTNSHITTIVKKNIAICNYDNRNTEIYDYCLDNVKTYSKLHRYSHIVFKKCEHSPWWCKIFFIKELLNKNIYDYIVWIDSDAIFMNMNTRLENIINDIYSITIGVDYYDNINLIKYNGRLNINSGFFIIKNNDIGNMFIDKCIDIYNKQKHTCLPSKNIYSKMRSSYSGFCYEQYVMARLIKTDFFSKHTNILDKHVIWNSHIYPTYYNPFVYHVWQWFNLQGLEQLKKKFNEMNHS